MKLRTTAQRDATYQSVDESGAASPDFCTMNDENQADLILQRQVGQRIREIRLAKGISQETLAHEIGLHRTYVGSLERGERNPSLQVVSRLARLLEVNTNQLLVQDDD